MFDSSAERRAASSLIVSTPGAVESCGLSPALSAPDTVAAAQVAACFFNFLTRLSYVSMIRFACNKRFFSSTFSRFCLL